MTNIISKYPLLSVAIIIVLTILICMWWSPSVEKNLAEPVFNNANKNHLRDVLQVETKGSLGGMTVKDLDLEAQFQSQYVQ